MDDLQSLKDASMDGPLKTFRATSSSGFDLPPGTFIYNSVAVDSVSTTRDTFQFVIANSDDSLKWIRVSKQDTQTSLTCVRSLASAHKGLTCLQPLNDPLSIKAGISSFITAGRDGLLRVRTAVTGDVQMEFATPNKQPISAVSSFSIINGRSLVAAGTELLDTEPPGNVAVYIWAVPDEGVPRTNSKHIQPILSVTDSHTDTISNLAFWASPPSGFSIPPAGPKLIIHLISSSTDGLVNIISPDLPDEEDAVITALNNRNAVQYMHPFTGGDHKLLQSGQICSISQDEKLSVHAVPEPASEAVRSDPEPIDLRDMLKCDYTLGLLEQGGVEGVVLAVGASKKETTNQAHVDLYRFKAAPCPSEKPNLELAVRLVGAHGDEIVRDVWLHNSCPFILTCGEDGQVKVWEDVEGHAKPKIDKSGKTIRTKRKDARRKDRKRKGDEREQDGEDGANVEVHPSKRKITK